jgi:hypothetical protein
VPSIGETLLLSLGPCRLSFGIGIGRAAEIIGDGRIYASLSMSQYAWPWSIQFGPAPDGARQQGPTDTREQAMAAFRASYDRTDPDAGLG